ncbi:MAG: prepilin-type N-terminal cleavage/methylation domain-containing protein [Pseudomonadota bacterium]
MKNRKGFTLIEIIAVLVILGVLAAVATPKFMDMQAEAKKKAAQGAVAAGLSACSLTFAKSLLDGTTFSCATALLNVKWSSSDDKLDLDIADHADGCTVTADYDGTIEAAVWENPNN